MTTTQQMIDELNFVAGCHEWRSAEPSRKELHATIDRGYAIMYRKMADMLSQPIQAKWNTIESAPTEGIFELTGSSGSIYPNDKFLVLAFRKQSYRGDRFLFPDGSCIDDFGWTPTHWRPASILPK